MNQELKEKWLAALRSGKYLQGMGWLKQELAGGDRFCCLGVLCEIEPSVIPAVFGQILSEESCARIGLAIDGQHSQLALSNMNDNGKTFAEIADYIEGEPMNIEPELKERILANAVVYEAAYKSGHEQGYREGRAEALKQALAMMEALEAKFQRAHVLRTCNCADPENCKQAVPGYVCKAGRTIWQDDAPTVDEVPHD